MKTVILIGAQGILLAETTRMAQEARKEEGGASFGRIR